MINKLLRKILFLLPLFLLPVLSANAITVSTIGTQNSTSSSGGPTTTTLDGRTDRHAAIYTAGELSAAGLVNGSKLLSIGWEKTGVGSYLSGDMTIRVWLTHRSTVNFSANPTFATEIASATQVYETTTGLFPAATGWLTFEFNLNSFTWNGTDNIEVITEIIHPGDYESSTFSWRTTTSSANAAANANGTTAPATLTRSSTGVRPQIRFDVATPGDDAALVSLPAPSLPAPGVQNISVVLKNTGATTLTSANIDWTINGGTPTTYNWTGSLATGASATVIIGSSNFAVGSTTIQATVSSPNGAADAFPSNNSVSKTILICNPLSGNTYTINSGAATGGNNFNNFTDLASTLKNCGISGPVTVTVTPGSGPYTDQIILQDIAGLAANSLTIQGSGEIITSDTAINQTGSNPDRYIIRMINASNITINNLKVNMFPGSTGWMGVHGMGTSSNITVSNCSFDMGSATSTLLAGIVFNNAPASNLTPGGTISNITITGNSFSGGGYGVSVVGLSSPFLATGVVISNNTFVDFSSNGIYFRETNGAVVSGNTFDRVNGTGSSNAVQYAQSENINGQVNNNYFQLTSAVAGLVCVHFNNGTGHKAYNNVVRNIAPTSGTVAAFHLVTAGTAPQIYNNTISIDNTANASGSFYGIRLNTAATNAALYNNVISITQPTTGAKAAITHPSGTVTVINSSFSTNHNLFWVPGGYVYGTLSGSTFTGVSSNLSAWNGTYTTKDANSIEVDPAFVSPAVPRPNNLAANNAGTPFGGLTVDIDGTTRNNPPDVGAYEFTGFPLSVNLGNFRGERKGESNVLYWNTYSETGNAGFDVERSADGVNFEKIQFVASQANEGNSTLTLNYTTTDRNAPKGTNYYRLKQVDVDGKATYSNVVLLKDGVTNGSFAINELYPNPAKATLNVSLSSVTEGDVTLVIADIKGAVILQQAAKVVAGQNSVAIPVAQLPAGIYTITAAQAGGSTKSIKFVKE